MSTKNETRVQVLPTVEAVKPAEVVIGANIRTDPNLDDEFTASVAQHGVLIPVMAYRGEDGAVVVVDGQRRTLAAIKAGVEAMPALIGEGPEDAERITRQWAANEARSQMNAGERFDAIRQMSLIGLSAATISKQMSGVTKAEVSAVKKADKAGITPEQVNDRPELSLLDQATLAEFADEPEALDYLRGASGEALARRVKQWRADKARKAMLEAAAVDWSAKGASVEVTRYGPSYDDRRPAPEALTTRDGKKLPEDVDTLAQMPGVVLVLSPSTRSVETEDGKYEVEDYVEVAVRINEPAKNGYMRRFHDDQGNLLDAEQAKAERRAVRAAKEQWATDQRARREFIAGLLDAKAFTAAEKVVADGLIHLRVNLYQDAPLFEVSPEAMLRPLTGARTPAKRRLQVAAVAALMAWEAGVDPNTAAHPRPLDKRMFAALTKAGYEPTDSDRGIAENEGSRF